MHKCIDIDQVCTAVFNQGSKLGMVQCSVLSAVCTVERTAGVAGVDFIDSVLCGFPHQLPCTSEIGQVCSSEVWETRGGSL